MERRELDPFPPARGSGERCKLPQQGPGQSPGRKNVFLYFRGARRPLLELVGASSGGAWLPCPPYIHLSLRLLHESGTAGDRTRDVRSH